MITGANIGRMAFALHPAGPMTAGRKRRNTGRRRLSAAAIIGIVAVVATGWVRADGNVAALERTGAPIARAIAVAATSTAAATAEVQSLAADLQGMIRVPGWSNDAWGVMVVSLDHGDTLFAYRADEALAPASNLKLYTSAAALYYLGPEYRYATYLATDGKVEDGVLTGDLHLYGTGDPTLSERAAVTGMEVWRAFADTLAAQGVREIRGDIVGDGSYFQGPGTGAGWQFSYINAWYAAPAGALSFNENVVTLRVRPGDQVGWRPEVLTVPGAPPASRSRISRPRSRARAAGSRYACGVRRAHPGAGRDRRRRRHRLARRAGPGSGQLRRGHVP